MPSALARPAPTAPRIATGQFGNSRKENRKGRRQVMSMFAALLVAIVVAVSVGVAGETVAQTQRSPGAEKPATPEAEKPATAEKKVEGQVKSIDAAKKEMTLTDGTTFTISEGTTVPPDVKAGASVTASYKEEAGKKVLTSVEVQPAASPRTTPPAGGPKR
jgi:cytoskeletal protein RodZ